jgi:hypothetical protein
LAKRKKKKHNSLWLFVDCGFEGIYGTQGTGTESTTPGSREGPSQWITANGEFRMFGGSGYSNPPPGELAFLCL